MTAPSALPTLAVGGVVTLELGRDVRIVGSSDGTILRDHRRRIAVRNVATNRLSYIQEWRLVNALAHQRAKATDAQEPGR